MNVSPKVLLVTPPFTQLNTPYPAMMYLKGFLNTKGVDSVQVDLSLEVILEIFSSRGLHELFQQVAAREIRLSDNARRIFALQEEYERTIDAVMAFLQGRNRTLAYSICESYFLPRASRFEQEEDTEWAFGVMGLEDKARYLLPCTWKICLISCKRPWMSISGLVATRSIWGVRPLLLMS